MWQSRTTMVRQLRWLGRNRGLSPEQLQRAQRGV
jgi:hypothetical protein